MSGFLKRNNPLAGVVGREMLSPAGFVAYLKTEATVLCSQVNHFALVA